MRINRLQSWAAHSCVAMHTPPNPAKLVPHLGRRIRALRAERGCTQEVLAELAGCTATTSATWSAVR